MALPEGRRLMELLVGDPPRVRFFDCHVSELANVEAASPGRVISFRDITEAEVQRRALEEGREALEAQLRQAQKLEMVGTMAGGIAHDFNNILAMIHGHAELAAMDLPEGSEVREDLTKILQGTVRARHLVRQILTFSRQAPENRREISLSEVLEEGLELFFRATMPDDITIKAELKASGTTMFADSTQMQQVLMNRCSNAADTMADREEELLEITLSTQRPEPGQIPDHMALNPGHERVRLQVRDDGAGMDDTTRQKVFEPFYTTKEVGRGTGLGMAVVHGIVMSHRGWVEVASRMGSGSTVTIWLPGTDGEGARPETPPEKGSASVDTTTTNVLVVDDEEGLLQLTGRLLSGMGHEVRVARSVQEARNTIESEPQWLDLVLTDYAMPGETGLDLARAVGAVPRIPPSS